VAVAEPSVGQFSHPVAKYVAATRPPFLLASLVPCFIGLATAAFDGVELNWLYGLLTIVGALTAHAGVNVLNDYYDALNGTDERNEQRLFPFTGGSRCIQNGVLTPKETVRFGTSLLLCTSALGLVLFPVAEAGLLGIGALGLLIGWAYSAPPLALNSRGLGELSVACGFGILIPLGADLVQRGSLSLLPVAAGFSYALLAALLLYINQFPDRRADQEAGKRHWVVRLGALRARWGYPLVFLAAYSGLGVLVGVNILPVWALLGLATLPLSLGAARGLLMYGETPSRLTPFIRATIAAAILHGGLVAVGLAIAGYYQ